VHNDENIREIRRYRNRRLYDVTTAQTITHRDLGGFVREGASLRITDFATGKNITVDVLAQVARLEVAGWPDQGEVENVYRDIIERGSEVSKKAIHSVILAGLGALSLTREKAEEIIDHLIKRGELEGKDRKTSIDDLIEKAEDQAKKFSKTMKEQAIRLRGVKREEHDALRSEVEELRDMVKELKAQLHQED
jgi:polyhydroxyalkanoate synthesis regulator phasin